MSPAARIDRDRAECVARNDMALGLSSLFRAMPDGARRREVTLHQPWCGGEIVIQGVECNALDQAVLLALLMVAGQSDPLPDPGAPSVDLMAAGLAVQREVVRVNTSTAVLMRAAGLDPDSHGSRHALRASLRRLSGIVIEGRRGDAWAMTHLIAGAAGRGRDAISVALNYRLTDALLGIGSYARVEMDSYLALETGVARLVYAWLCAWFAGAAGARRIGIDSLEVHVYGVATQSRQTRSKRRIALRAALAQIDALPGWRAAVDSAGMVTVTRGDDTSNRPSGRQQPAQQATPKKLEVSSGAACGPAGGAV
ncbi:MAG: replication protein C, IncQ-type [Solirubrobacteraceae bacterium]